MTSPERANDLFIQQVAGTIAPLCDEDEIFARFGIDFVDFDDTSRFSRALSAILTSGLALLRSPPNLLEGYMPELSAHQYDWDTIVYLVAALFIHNWAPLMSAQEWIDMLRQQRVLYSQAHNSHGFGMDTPEWLDHIDASVETRHELFTRTTGLLLQPSSFVGTRSMILVSRSPTPNGCEWYHAGDKQLCRMTTSMNLLVTKEV